MRLKVRFAISLAAILLLSWADVFFAGTSGRASLPLLWHQPVHLAALLTTMLTGYLNWKDYPEKWLAKLWLLAYSAMIIVLGIAGIIYLLHVPYSIGIVRAAFYLRNRFTWPIVFLIWYMLHLMTSYLGAKKDGR